MVPTEAVRVSRLNWIIQPFVIIALATGKISVAFLILRIMGKSRWRRVFLIYFAMGGSFVFCSVAIILTFAQCRPVEALWNPSLVLTGKAKCWPPMRQSNFSVFVGGMIYSRSGQAAMLTVLIGWLAAIDLCLALLPITVMWNLHLSLKRRIGLSAIMGLGVL